jgi:ribonuclease BN (tRNA processing enzyme)
VQNAEILITECTFYDSDHRAKAKAGRHLHLDQFAEIVPKLKNKHIVVTHVSRRTAIRRAKYLLRKKIGDELMKNITFLMDFEGATDAGDVEDAGPNPMDSAAE